MALVIEASAASRPTHSAISPARSVEREPRTAEASASAVPEPGETACTTRASTAAGRSWSRSATSPVRARMNGTTARAAWRPARARRRTRRRSGTARPRRRAAASPRSAARRARRPRRRLLAVHLGGDRDGAGGGHHPSLAGPRRGWQGCALGERSSGRGDRPAAGHERRTSEGGRVHHTDWLLTKAERANHTTVVDDQHPGRPRGRPATTCAHWCTGRRTSPSSTSASPPPARATWSLHRLAGRR